MSFRILIHSRHKILLIRQALMRDECIACRVWYYSRKV